MATITLTKAQVEEIYAAMRQKPGGVTLPYNARVSITTDAPVEIGAPYAYVKTPRETITIRSDGAVIA